MPIELSLKEICERLGEQNNPVLETAVIRMLSQVPSEMQREGDGWIRKYRFTLDKDIKTQEVVIVDSQTFEVIKKVTVPRFAESEEAEGSCGITDYSEAAIVDDHSPPAAMNSGKSNKQNEMDRNLIDAGMSDFIKKTNRSNLGAE